MNIKKPVVAVTDRVELGTEKAVEYVAFPFQYAGRALKLASCHVRVSVRAHRNALGDRQLERARQKAAKQFRDDLAAVDNAVDREVQRQKNAKAQA